MVVKLDYALCAGVAAGLVGSAAALIYLRAIFQGETKPNRATWWILAAVGTILAASHYSSGARHTMWLALVYALIPLVVALVSIRHGEGGCGRLDLTCIITAGISVVLWWVFQRAVIALAINLLIDFIGLLPTIRKAYLRPQSENRVAWTLAFLASAISLVAVDPWKLSIALYPIYMATANGLIASILWLSPALVSMSSRRRVAWLLPHGILIASLLAQRPTLEGEQVTALDDKISDEKPEHSAWIGDAGLNFVTEYFAYGILAENQGVIAQPYFDLYYTLHESDGLITKVFVGFQLWSSIHSEKTDAEAGSVVPAWYEHDYYIPISFTLAKRFSLTASYFEYDFPNGAFETLRGVSTSISFDDSDTLGAFALHPHITVLYNYNGVLGLKQSDAWYCEIGVAPAMILAKKSNFPMTVTFPITIGLGDERFYPGDHLGFVSTGVSLSMPLTRISKSLENWTVDAVVTHLHLGDATAELNANRNHDVNIGQLGLGLTF